MSELLSPALKTIHKLVPFSSYSSMYSPVLLAYITDLTTRHWPLLPLSLCQGSGTFFSFPSTFLFQTAKIRRLNGQGTVSQCPSFRETSLTHQSSVSLGSHVLSTCPAHCIFHGPEFYLSSELVPSSWKDPYLLLLCISQVPNTHCLFAQQVLL